MQNKTKTKKKLTQQKLGRSENTLNLKEKKKTKYKRKFFYKKKIIKPTYKKHRRIWKIKENCANIKKKIKKKEEGTGLSSHKNNESKNVIIREKNWLKCSIFNEQLNIFLVKSCLTVSGSRKSAQFNFFLCCENSKLVGATFFLLHVKKKFVNMSESDSFSFCLKKFLKHFYWLIKIES